MIVVYHAMNRLSARQGSPDSCIIAAGPLGPVQIRTPSLLQYNRLTTETAVLPSDRLHSTLRPSKRSLCCKTPLLSLGHTPAILRTH